MIHCRATKSFTLIACFSSLCSISHAITLVPAWEGDPLTTDASYTFTTNSRTAPPEDYNNPHGPPALLVEDETFFGTGWQDPNGEYQLTRVPGEGAWDLGQAGRLSITIPISVAGDLSAKELEVFVNLIWYQSPASAPSITIGGHIPTTSFFESELVQSDGAGSWRRTVWSATYDGFTPDFLTLVFQAPSNGSVIDAITAYTLIPEVGTVSLILLGASIMVMRRNRPFWINRQSDPTRKLHPTQ